MSMWWEAKGVVRRLQGDRRGHRAGGRRRADLEPNRGWRAVVAIAVPIALLDWTTKWLVIERVPLGGFRVLDGGWVAIWHVNNNALVLGLHGGLPLGLRKLTVVIYAFLALVFLVAVLGRGHRLPPRRRKWAWIFLGMVVGGLLGNLTERLVHWSVTDFLSFRWGNVWLPPGNLADLSIVFSIPAALLVLLAEWEAKSNRADSAPDPDGAVSGRHPSAERARRRESWRAFHEHR